MRQVNCLKLSPPTQRRQKGFSLIEVLIVTALMSAVSLLTMVLYNVAIGDFEHANTKLSMNRYARNAASKISTILSTAAARRPGPIAEAFYYPDDTNSGIEYSYLDFLSTSNFIKTSPTEVAYAFDTGELGSGGGDYTMGNLFRYRMAFTDVAIGPIRRNTVYLERLNLNPNTPQPLPYANTPLTFGGTPVIGSAAPLGGYRQTLSTNIQRCTFRRTFAGTLQLRILVYAFDPVTGVGLDGQTMRTMTKKRRHDVTGATDEKSYELLTAIPLPTLNIK